MVGAGGPEMIHHQRIDTLMQRQLNKWDSAQIRPSENEVKGLINEVRLPLLCLWFV